MHVVQATELEDTKQFVNKFDTQDDTLRWNPALHTLQVLLAQVSQLRVEQAKQFNPDK
jgi:hypothetical protein